MNLKKCTNWRSIFSSRFYISFKFFLNTNSLIYKNLTHFWIQMKMTHFSINPYRTNFPISFLALFNGLRAKHIFRSASRWSGAADWTETGPAVHRKLVNNAMHSQLTKPNEVGWWLFEQLKHEKVCKSRKDSLLVIAGAWQRSCGPTNLFPQIHISPKEEKRNISPNFQFWGSVRLV